MSLIDGVIGESRRPFLSSNLWVPLLLILIACMAVMYYGHQVAETLKQSVADSARAGGRATAHAIAGFLDREHERLQAFVDEKHSEIRKILAQPDDWQTIEALQGSLQRLFRGAIAFTVTDSDGEPLFADFDGLVGSVCQAAMREFVQMTEFGRETYEIPAIHPVPGAYHFDLITPWKLDKGKSGLFFVSMAPGRIAELLDAAEKASGTQILLVNRDDPSLIEVSAKGARDVLGESFRVPAEALVPEHYSIDLPGTHWHLLVLPDSAALSAAVREVYINVAVLVLAILLISAALLFAIRRFEQRNSTLFMRSLQSSVSRQRAILQSMVDGMVTINAQGRILHVNSAITRLFGYEERDLMGSNVRMLMPEPDHSAHDSYLRNYLETGQSKILGNGREVMARRRDGSLFPIMLTLGESVEGDEHIFVGILHDMSAYKDAQRKIVSQAMAIKRTRQDLDEISQVAAKDLQPPLQRIASLGEALGAVHSSMLSGSEKAQLKSLADEARDMSELVKGIADYTRVEREPTAQVVDLDAILQDVQKDLANLISSSGASITVTPLGSVNGSHRQLRQVFWNLIDNAIKFRDPQRAPAIEITIADDAERPADTADDKVVVLVRDNAIGIPQDELEGVFEAFHRLHPRDSYPGMGLGLSFCRKIVEGLGGRISVTSEPGVGSTFRVVLARPV